MDNRRQAMDTTETRRPPDIDNIKQRPSFRRKNADESAAVRAGGTPCIRLGHAIAASNHVDVEIKQVHSLHCLSMPFTLSAASAVVY